MRKSILILSMCIAALFAQASTPFCAEKENDFDFKNTRWGMTKEEVLKKEGKEPKAIYKSSIEYEEELLGKKMTLLYTFTEENKLNSASYFFTCEDEDMCAKRNIFKSDNELENFYRNFVPALTEKYGQPRRLAFPGVIEALQFDADDVRVRILRRPFKEKTPFSFIYESKKYAY